MAIILPGSLCAICGKPFTDLEEKYATSAFLDPSHELWRYSDAPMHWLCLLSWNRRNEFAHAYASAKIASEQHQPFWHAVVNSPNVFITYGERTREVNILLKEIPISFKIALTDFDRWLGSPVLPDYLARFSTVADAFERALSEILAVGSAATVEGVMQNRREEIAAKRDAAVRRLGLKIGE